MQDNSSISDKQTALRLAYAPASSGTTGTATFRKAIEEASAAADASSNTSNVLSAHVVKPGDTLYGIARARLVSMGRAADPGASMRYALQLAHANDMLDPNRIQSGQRLNLPEVGATSNASQARVAVPGTPASSPAATATARAWEMRVIDEPQPDDLDAIEFDVADLLPQPLPAARLRTETTEPVHVSETPLVPAAREGVARYKQIATPSPEPATEVPDILYKGIVGKVLDILPLDASTRTGLQQANAVIGSSIAARSLAALTGIGAPVLTLAGLIWGLFSAQKIEDQQNAKNSPADPSGAPSRSAAVASASVRYEND